MHIIYLPGNSIHNKSWIEDVKSHFDAFSSGEILYYQHWTNGGQFIDFDVEGKRLAELVKDRDDYCVFAKSVGSILALKTLHEGIIHPQKALLCGYPYNLAKKMELPINDYLKSLTIPVTFVQNEFDPLYSYADLEKTLEEHTPSEYMLVKIAGNDSHDYEDYEKLEELVKDSF